MKISDIKLVAITAFASSSLLMGCSEEVYEGAYKPSLESHYLGVYPRDFEFGNGEETKTGSITSENAWSFTSVPSWLSLTPSNGNSDAEFAVTSTVNESMSSKTTVFYLTANASDWNQQRTITASQTAASPYFQFVNLENTSIYLTGESHVFTVDVESNIDDLAVKIYDAESWLSASYKDKQLTITVNVNDDGYERSGRVQLWSSSYSKGGVIYITQYKPNLSFDDITSLSFDADGGSQNVNITSEIPWFALSKESWIEITPTEGEAGSNQVKISALPSYQSENRNGKALFYYKDNQSAVGSVSISQTGRYLNISPTSISLSAEDKTSKEVEVESNIDWKVLYCPEWLSISPQSGASGKSKFNISATDNRSLNSRSSTVALSDATEGIQATVNVVQSGLNFGDNTVLEFSWKNGQQNLAIPIPNNWIAAVSEDWIKLSQYEGSGSADIVVSVDQNNNEASRQGILSFTSEGKTISITILQLGQYLQINNTSGEFSAMGGSLDLTISTSVDITASVEYIGNTKDWISLKSNDNRSYVITADYNPTTTLRDANIVILPIEDGVSDKLVQGLKFAIKQQGRNISTDVSKIIMYSKGGTSSTYSITSDGKYIIEKGIEDYWYSLVSDNSNNTFCIVVTKNTTGAKRIGQIRLYLTDLPSDDNGKMVTISVEQSESDYNIDINDYENDEILE